MILILPYPDNFKFTSRSNLEQSELVINFLSQVEKDCKLWCKGPWNFSIGDDVLYDGIRVRIGNSNDSFMLTLKYGVVGT